MSKTFKSIKEIEKILHLPKINRNREKIGQKRTEKIIKALENNEDILIEYKNWAESFLRAACYARHGQKL